MRLKLFISVILFFVYGPIFSGTIPFITTWETTNLGASNDNQITIPTFPGIEYNYTVEWGDGSTSEGVTGDIIHTYNVPGTYSVNITGVFPRIFFNNTGDSQKIISIDQWGNNEWTSMEDAFNGCSFLVGTYTDIPNLTGVTNMSRMFQLASSFNSSVANWDVSNVTTMSALFNNFTTETIVETVTPIENTTFTNVVRQINVVAAFNQDLSSWNVGNVTDMSFMFAATPFNQNINNWNVGNVINMQGMFFIANNFNQDLSSWNVGNVTDMSFMFEDAVSFNSEIGGWNVSNVITMQSMFEEASLFNSTLLNWNVSNVIDMSFMFASARSFNQDISTWNTNNVLSTLGMFSNTDLFNQDISSWNVSNVQTMEGMFFSSSAFNQDISSWNVSNVINMRAMFALNTVFNQDINNWNVENVISMNLMFFNATGFNQNIGGWDVSSLLDAGGMFDGVELSVENYDALLIGWESNIVNLDVPFSGGLSRFCAGEQARERLQSINNWNIVDAGRVQFSVDNLPNTIQVAEYSYVLPEITGIGLTGNEAYYSEEGGAGIRYEPGDVISFSDTEVYPIDIFIYDEIMAIHTCFSEEQFSLELTMCGSTVNPVLDNVNDVIESSAFTFPSITGSTLTGNQAYYTGQGGTGVRYEPGDVISFSDFPSYPIDLYIFDEYFSVNNYTCTSEVQFELTITEVLPECTTLTFPLDGAIDVSLDLASIRWNNIDNAEGYILNIGTVPGGNDIVDEELVSDTEYFFNEELPSATQIYVSITPFNIIGNATSCIVESFSTEVSIEIPGFFTPNNDGVNDFWVLQNPFSTFDKAYLFDRSGKLLNVIIDPEQGWDGNFKGDPLPTDSYWYSIHYTTGEIFKGSLLLKR